MLPKVHRTKSLFLKSYMPMSFCVAIGTHRPSPSLDNVNYEQTYMRIIQSMQACISTPLLTFSKEKQREGKSVKPQINDPNIEAVKEENDISKPTRKSS